MTRLVIVVEGQTEREFVQNLLAEYLLAKGVYLSPILLNGNVTVDRLTSEIVRLVSNFDYVSSMVDFYGFRGKGNATPDELERRIEQEVKARISSFGNRTRVIPYVQRHEFESLLFSNVSAFSDVTIASPNQVRELRDIRLQFSTPEDINDSKDTAPSKRIKRIIPRYDKVANGPLVAESTGLAAIRAECPRFNSWLNRLESLDDPPS